MKKILLIVFSSVLLGTFCWLAYEESQKILSQSINSWEEDQSADCAVVLTGGPGRVREGFDLLAQKKIKKLIISGVYPGSTLREIFPQWPFYGTVDIQDVILEKRSGTTYGNAQQSLPLAEALNCRDLLLVTSSLHMYRAKRIFYRLFPEEIKVYPRAILSGPFKPKVGPVMIEIFKSLFYSFWAY